MTTLQRLNELHAIYDGPVPLQYLRPAPLPLAVRISDAQKIVACRRKLALAALSERRLVRCRNRHGFIFEYADHCARREVRRWREGRAMLAGLRAEGE